MHIAVRPYAAAGVALLSAGVIAVSPVAPQMPAIQAAERALTSANVQLAASVDPIELWVQVFQTAAANLTVIGQQVAANPTPILSQVIANQVASFTALGNSLQSSAQTVNQIFQSAPDALQTALTQLQDGNIVGAVDTFNNNLVIPLTLAALQVVSDSLRPVVSTVQNFGKAFATLPDDVFAVVLPMTYPLLSAVNAIVQTTQDVSDGVAAGDVGAVVNALVNAPAHLVGGVLNGAGSILGGLLPAAGILTPYDPNFGFLASGPISSLIALRETIAQALGATPPAPPAAAATSAVSTVPALSRTISLAVPAAEAVDTTSGGATTKAGPSKHKLELAATTSAATAEASSAAVDSASTGTSADSDSSDSPAATRTHESAKPGSAHKGGAAKSGKSGASTKSAAK
jgi:hypothetical protein